MLRHFPKVLAWYLPAVLQPHDRLGQLFPMFCAAIALGTWVRANRIEANAKRDLRDMGDFLFLGLLIFIKLGSADQVLKS